MNQLQRFYQWIATTPLLFENQVPFASIAHLPTTPLVASDEYSGNPRLGFLYQYLCTKLFETSSQYDVVIEEAQVNDHTGRTLGAIDLILKNNQTMQYEHWEVAIKFYLLHQGVWYGPNAHDQLDKKLDRMLTHQLKMSKTSEFLSRFPDFKDVSEHLLLQGRLYINPFIDEAIPDQCLGYTLNPSQISGHWCFQSQFNLINEPLYPLDKTHWATGLTDFDEPLTLPANRFVHAQTKQGKFWFIVPDSWPASSIS